MVVVFNLPLPVFLHSSSPYLSPSSPKDPFRQDVGMMKGIFGVLIFAGVGFLGVFYIYPLNTPAAGVLASLFAPMALNRALGVSLSSGPLAAQAAKSMPLGGLIGFLCFDFLWGACLLIYCELLFDDAGRSCCFCLPCCARGNRGRRGGTGGAGGGGDYDAKLVELRNRGDAPMGGRDAEGGHKDEVRGRSAARHSMNEI